MVILILSLLLLTSGALAAEVMPPKPKRYFNDYAGVTSVEVQQRLDRRLEALERTNSTQILVAIYPRMQSDSSIEDYTVRVAHSWGVGQKGKDNGAVLFVFVQDRKLYIQVGYGLEGAIPDAIAKEIIDRRITPHFRNGDYNSGLIAGVDALIQAAAGEYRGTGRTVAESQRARDPQRTFFVGVLIFFILVAAWARRHGRRGYLYGGRRRHSWGPIVWMDGPGTGRGGGFGGGGGWSGGFSGGGGRFGGGGAGGSW